MALLKHKTQDLTQGPLAKQILLFSLPLMATSLLQVLFNMADLAVVGRFAGPMPLGSVGSTAQMVFLFTGLLIDRLLSGKRLEDAAREAGEHVGRQLRGEEKSLLPEQ